MSTRALALARRTRLRISWLRGPVLDVPDVPSADPHRPPLLILELSELISSTRKIGRNLSSCLLQHDVVPHLVRRSEDHCARHQATVPAAVSPLPSSPAGTSVATMPAPHDESWPCKSNPVRLGSYVSRAGARREIAGFRPGPGRRASFEILADLSRSSANRNEAVLVNRACSTTYSPLRTRRHLGSAIQHTGTHRATA